jgi:hypothetical protein
MRPTLLPCFLLILSNPCPTSPHSTHLTPSHPTAATHPPCLCRLELKSGELPAAFELDERAHPSLTDHLLHLVHGRTLLGVVQTPHTLSLAGAHMSLLA